MKKNKVKKIHGVKTVLPITKDHNRPLLPPGKTFRQKTDYDRRMEKQKIRKMLEES